MKVVVKLQPFVLKQNLFTISDDGEVLDSANIDLPELNKAIFSYLNQYSATQVDLVGPRNFAKGIQNDLIKEKKYSNQEITIKII